MQESVKKLREQLLMKDSALTEISLEALSSAHTLESFKEIIFKLHADIMALKNDSNINCNVPKVSDNIFQEVEQLKAIVEKSCNTKVPVYSEPKPPTSLDEVLQKTSSSEDNGKKVNVVVLLGCHGDYDKYMGASLQDSYVLLEYMIGQINISGKTKWNHLDDEVNKVFEDYIIKIDPEGTLGLTVDSILSYHLGEISRCKDAELPELLPCGYLIGDVKDLKIVLRGSTSNSVDALAFETLIPKVNLKRYVSLLTEHRRIILCGPSKTGKSYLARKLAEYLVSRLGVDPSSGNIATFG